tara:strand:- start:112 stop:387 length:276 start_codon:yes stop_codon:yes gene_type:complete
MIDWALYTIVLAFGSAAIGWEKGMKPKENSNHNGLRYLAIIFFAVGQSAFATTFYRAGLTETLFSFGASMVVFGPVAYGIGYFIRKNSLSK